MVQFNFVLLAENKLLKHLIFFFYNQLQYKANFKFIHSLCFSNNLTRFAQYDRAVKQKITLVIGILVYFDKIILTL